MRSSKRRIWFLTLLPWLWCCATAADLSLRSSLRDAYNSLKAPKLYRGHECEIWAVVAGCPGCLTRWFTRFMPPTLAEHLQDGKPQWLEDFLAKPYSKPCLLQAHADAGFNTNKFCVDCRTPVCHSCITEFGHTNHAIIQVYRHVYQDSASMRAIRSFININGIQTYKSNQASVVALRPLLSISKINQNGPVDNPPKRAKPNSRINKSSDRKNRIERMCKICGKKLVPTHQFHYCSIQCKSFAQLADYMSKSDRSVPPFLMPGTQTLDEACSRGKVDGKERADEATATRRRKRKGIPRRAPFF